MKIKLDYGGRVYPNFRCPDCGMTLRDTNGTLEHEAFERTGFWNKPGKPVACKWKNTTWEYPQVELQRLT